MLDHKIEQLDKIISEQESKLARLRNEDDALTKKRTLKGEECTRAVKEGDPDQIKTAYNECNGLERELNVMKQEEKSTESRLDELSLERDSLLSTKSVREQD